MQACKYRNSCCSSLASHHEAEEDGGVQGTRHAIREGEYGLAHRREETSPNPAEQDRREAAPTEDHTVGVVFMNGRDL